MRDACRSHVKALRGYGVTARAGTFQGLAARAYVTSGCEASPESGVGSLESFLDLSYDGW